MIGAIAFGTLANCSEAARDLGQPVNVQASASLADVVAGKAAAADSLCVEGVLAEICPTSGCWAYLQQGDATLRLEFLEFTLTANYRGQRCRAVGKLKSQADPPVLVVRGLKLL